MCGIYGYVGNGRPIPLANVLRGLHTLTDRGPDSWGLYLPEKGKIDDQSNFPDNDCTAVLGSRRLSILDLSEAGNQPMGSDEEGWIVYNGEIYNYRELRDDLRDRGYEFISDTDTEVVLQAYREYGEACVEHFRGMFAFAIHNPIENELFAARDRFGIKPFYYDYTDDRITFASEVSALLESGVSEPSLDPVSVDGFLTFGSIPEPRTIVDGIQSLPAGSHLYYDADNGTCDIESYWTPSFSDDDPAAADRVRKLLAKSVDIRLRSDVPVGAFLSGGLDSSTIVALMRDATEEADEDNGLHTFSIGFDHEEYSETAFAELVVESLETAHTSRTVTANDVRAELDDIIAAMDQPTIDGVNTYFISKVAAEANLKVALSGLGSDELFFGYSSFKNVPQWTRIASILYNIPSSVRQPIARGIDQLGAVIPGAPIGELADTVRSNSPFGAAYVAQRGLFTSSQRQSLLGTDPVDWSAQVEDEVKNTLNRSSTANAVSHAELAWYMRNQLLRDTDVMSMAHSLEVRVPFLDTELAEYLMDSSAESKQGGEKQLLKDAVADDVPLEIIEREKTGFTFPFDDWLTDELRDVVNDALDRDHIERTPLNPDACREVIRKFDRNEIHWSRLWALVVVSLWVGEHLSEE